MALPLHICLNSSLDTRLSGLYVPLLNSSLSCPQTTSYKQYGQRSFVYAATFSGTIFPFKFAMLVL